MEEVDDAGPLLGPREECGEEGDSEVVPEGGEENPEFLEYAAYPRKYRVSRIPQLWWDPHAMATKLPFVGASSR